MSYFEPKLSIEPDIKFYDTSSLLLMGERLFETKEPFIVSSITLNELEDIKTSANKDADVKYLARVLLRLLDKHPEQCKITIHKTESEYEIVRKGLIVNNDTRILSDAIHCNYRDNNIIFVTNDLALKQIANLFFGDKMIISADEETDEYTGYKEVIADDDTMAEFYQEPEVNHFDLLVNQYLILKDTTGEVKDLRVWTGEEHRYLNTSCFKSEWLGKIGPYDGDVFQKLAFDSLRNNQITALKGPAGSGKSILALSYLLSELENHKLDKLLLFCNPVAAINSAKLGYTPGSLNEKLLDSQIGNFLSSKLGGKFGIESLMSRNQLELLPFSNLRGYDTSGLRAGIYITEAQNLDRTLMKLALQRIGPDCKCILDGDDRSQVDLLAYAGSNNGLRRVSKVFRGHDIYGEVQLQNIYRSEIVRIAENI